MADDAHQNKRTNTVTVIDLPNDFSSNIRTRTVQLYDTNVAFDVISTPTNFEDSVVVFLDSNNTTTKEQFLEIITHVDRNSSYFKSFKNIDEGIDFISSLEHGKVFLILLFTDADRLVPLIHNMLQLASVYVCSEKEDENIDSEKLKWIDNFSIVRGKIYKIGKDLFHQLHNDIESMRSPPVNSMLFSMRTKTSTTVKALETEQASYQWNQLLLDALQKLSQNEKSRQDILNECKKQYHDDQSELKKIEEFEKTYEPQTAIRWYTRDCFLYRLVNKALQTEDIDVIFKFRFFIIDLYHQLVDVHETLKSEQPEILTVYRGQQVSADELENLKFNINSVISLKPFLSTTTNKDVALIYAGDGSGRPSLESVLFEIIIDVNKSQKPLADVSKMSQISHEDEVLLSMGMLFRINSVETSDSGVWTIQLTSINDSDIELKSYFKSLREDYQTDDPLLRLGTLLLETGSYDKAEKYLLMLLDEGTEHYPVLYNSLGLCCYALHNYRRALHYYTEALNHYITSDCTTHPNCCHVYNNMALIYEHQGDYREALNFYNKALQIHLQYPNIRQPIFALTLTRIGNIHKEFGNYNEALGYFLRALNVIQSAKVDCSRSLSLVHSNMGDTYLKLANYDESMKNYRAALKICQEVAPQSDDYFIGLSQISIGEVYYFKGAYDEALHHYGEAQQILEKWGILGRLSLATVYGNMGVIYKRKKEYTLALHYQTECLEIRKKYYPENSRLLGSSYSNIGLIHLATNNIEKSIKYIKMGIDCIQKCLTPNEPELAIFYNNLGRAYSESGDSEQALHYFNLSLDIKYRMYRGNHHTIGITLRNIAQLLLQNGDISTAIQYLEKAVKIFEETLDISHPDRRTTIMFLAFLKQIAFS